MSLAARPFLTGEWRWLAVLNYEADPAALRPLVPAGTELDLWSGRPFLSLVGFQFLKTRVLGVPVPFHRTFEEVNLRFYVRRREAGGWRRGVVFIRELVPRRAVAILARSLYNEKYRRVAMSHRIESRGEKARSASYSWIFRRTSSCLEVSADPAALADPAEQDFFAEHHWGYVTGRGRETLEYRVEHPRWTCWKAQSARFEGDARALYSDAFAGTLSTAPASAFLADGSSIAVFWRRPLEA